MGQAEQGVRGGRQRYTVIPRALIFLQNGTDILLLKGAPDKRLWANLYNGVGGHVEQGEDILSAARRETLEETGLEAEQLHLKAIAHIDGGDPWRGIVMYVFWGTVSQREVIDSEEGTLHWLPIKDLAQLPLVEDLAWLLPRILDRPVKEGPLFAHYHYDEEDQLIIEATE